MAARMVKTALPAEIFGTWETAVLTYELMILREVGSTLAAQSGSLQPVNLRNFDPALVVFTFAVVFAKWGVVFHYNVSPGPPPLARVPAGSRSRGAGPGP